MTADLNNKMFLRDFSGNDLHISARDENHNSCDNLCNFLSRDSLIDENEK